MNYRSPGAHSHGSFGNDGSDGATAVNYSRTPQVLRVTVIHLILLLELFRKTSRLFRLIMRAAHNRTGIPLKLYRPLVTR